MGYTTDFIGEFTLNKPLTLPQHAYLKRFAHSRRMKRDVSIIAKIGDPLRTMVGLPIGTEGEFFVGTDEMDKEIYKEGDPRYVSRESLMEKHPTWDNKTIEWHLKDNNATASHHGSRNDASVLDYNYSPSTQPGLWCDWVPNDEGTEILWNGNEKFYAYTEWLEYYIKNFLSPWGYVLNGEVFWQGEDSEDLGKIIIVDNQITIKNGKIVYE